MGEGEKHQCENETSIGCLLHAPKSTLTGIPTHDLLVHQMTPQPSEPHLWKIAMIAISRRHWGKEIRAWRSIGEDCNNTTHRGEETVSKTRAGASG